MKIALTNDWSYDRLAPYTKDITAAMKKLQERFPREVEVSHLAGEIISGKRQLWLVLDGDEFVSFFLSSIQTDDATGLKTLVVPSMAGDEGISIVPLAAEAIEAWGKSQGCDEAMVYGRYGWKRALAKQGYETDMAIFRKQL